MTDCQKQEAVPQGPRHYTVSGLDYTLPKLLMTMAIILVGTMTYSLCIGVVGRIVPLKLKELEVNSTLMVFIMTTMGQILNMTVCPWVSFKSDRYRSKRWGRRVPFILFTLPMLCASWVILALYHSEAELLRKVLSPVLELPHSVLAVVVLAIGVVCFKFFYMFVGSVIHYVYNDVIPPQFLTRFVGAVQITNAAMSALFNFFVFEHALSHFKWILLGTAAVYACGVGFFCFALKEPRFPEPTGQEKRKSQGLLGVLTFMRESFSHPIYWYEFLATAAAGIAGGTAIFTVFFQQSMGLSLAEIGQMTAYAAIGYMASSFVFSSIGAIFIDRWNPVRVSVFLLMFGMMGSVYECKWLFFSPPAQVFWWSMLLTNQAAFLARFRALSSLPALMRLLPKSRFGQFCSARSLLSSCIGLLFGLVLGVFIDFLKHSLELGEYAYRFIWVWQIVFCSLSFVFQLLLYRQFWRCGGYEHYRAPAPWSSSGYEEMQHSAVVPASPLWLRVALYGFDFALLGSAGMTLFWSWHARRIGAAEESRLYLEMTLPATVAAYAFFLTVRTFITAKLRKWRRGDSGTVLPHHGILMLVMLVRVLLLAALGVQAYLAIRTGSDGLSAKMGVFEACADAVMIVMIWIYVTMECKVADAAGNSGPEEPAAA